MSNTPEQVAIKGGSKLQGSVEAPPSKSHTHRALIAASLSCETSRIENPSLCKDAEATVRAVEAYGTDVNLKDGALVVRGTGRIELPVDVVNCLESASTMRFVTPILAHAKGISVVTGEASLRQRPMQPIIGSLKQLGVQCYSTRNDGHAPLVIFGGTYDGGKVRITGDLSSQFISGLLFSASAASKSTSIEVTTTLYSAPYVDMTLEILKRHGIVVESNSNPTAFSIRGDQTTNSHDHFIEGDYSSAAFLLAAGVVTGSEISVSGLKTSESLQGDSAILSLLKDMGVEVETGNGSVRVRRSNPQAIVMDATDCPDLVPPVAAIACYAQGKTKIMNAERLRTKESNRLSALSGELRKMGAEIRETADGLEIAGESGLKGAKVSSHGDHRIAMACSVAALGAKGETVVSGAGCIAKSYPVFFDDLKSLGGDIRGWK